MVSTPLWLSKMRENFCAHRGKGELKIYEIHFSFFYLSFSIYLLKVGILYNQNCLSVGMTNTFWRKCAFLGFYRFTLLYKIDVWCFLWRFLWPCGIYSKIFLFVRLLNCDGVENCSQLLNIAVWDTYWDPNSYGLCHTCFYPILFLV